MIRTRSCMLWWSFLAKAAFGGITMRKDEARAQGMHVNELENTRKLEAQVQYQRTGVHSYDVPEG